VFRLLRESLQHLDAAGFSARRPDFGARRLRAEGIGTGATMAGFPVEDIAFLRGSPEGATGQTEPREGHAIPGVRESGRARTCACKLNLEAEMKSPASSSDVPERWNNRSRAAPAHF
jgi:hypothetical protein